MVGRHIRVAGPGSIPLLWIVRWHIAIPGRVGQLHWGLSIVSRCRRVSVASAWRSILLWLRRSHGPISGARSPFWGVVRVTVAESSLLAVQNMRNSAGTLCLLPKLWYGYFACFSYVIHGGRRWRTLRGCRVPRTKITIVRSIVFATHGILTHFPRSSLRFYVGAGKIIQTIRRLGKLSLRSMSSRKRVLWNSGRKRILWNSGRSHHYRISIRRLESSITLVRHCSHHSPIATNSNKKKRCTALVRNQTSPPPSNSLPNYTTERQLFVDRFS
mmetsp:Transcript_2258/g.3343  ORF Transcript_2258/g.3343 Transcript_2258/m.3343 type:complete len:272 (-) Transcript_2258:42-857(-)